MNHRDLIVIGVGAVGSAALRAASEAGARVLGLEQFEPANTRGSSPGRSRIFRHAYFEHPDYVPLLRHSTSRLESLERESGAALLHRCGMLVAGPRDSRAVPGSLGSSRRWNLPVEPFESEAIVEGSPRLTMSIHWYMETAHLDDPHPPLWRIHVQGQPGVRIALDMQKRAGETSPTSAEQIAVAGTVINAIPIVCAAPPGIVTRPRATPFNFEFAHSSPG